MQITKEIDDANQFRPSHAEVVGKILTYSPTEFPFAELFLERFNLIQTKKGKKPTTRLTELHVGEDMGTLSDTLHLLYRFEEEDCFQKPYRAFLKKHIVPLFREPILFQLKPGIRIHLPESMTVSFHTDEWYGHGGNVYNFWLPLTPAKECFRFICGKQTILFIFLSENENSPFTKATFSLFQPTDYTNV